MWRFRLSKPILGLAEDGNSSVSFTCHEQEISFATDSQLSPYAFENIMSGTSGAEIHDAAGKRFRELVQVTGNLGNQYFSDSKVGQLSIWKTGRNVSGWHTSCFCELAGIKFQRVVEFSKIMLQSSRELTLVLNVGIIGFRVPEGTPIVPTSSEFENDVPYFFEKEDVSFFLLESN